AALYNKENRLQELVALLESARKVMPYRYLKYTQNLAFAYYRAGQTDRALSELESIRGRLMNETDPETLVSWYYLADLYRIKGRKEEAIQAARSYLEATKSMDPQAARLKKQAEDLIRSLQSVP
ncbi:MAG TPA: tetratricopeptide repeat protein, partial [Acidobacteriota bacterium]|nr:tetratricopeptide repeat protein [Acidobacteriota bacterium]